MTGTSLLGVQVRRNGVLVRFEPQAQTESNMAGAMFERLLAYPTPFKAGEQLKFYHNGKLVFDWRLQASGDYLLNLSHWMVPLEPVLQVQLSHKGGQGDFISFMCKLEKEKPPAVEPEPGLSGVILAAAATAVLERMVHPSAGMLTDIGRMLIVSSAVGKSLA